MAQSQSERPTIDDLILGVISVPASFIAIFQRLQGGVTRKTFVLR